jgi:DNA-binding SARP family transcriptional activator
MGQSVRHSYSVLDKMTKLCIQLLGPPRVFWKNEIIAIQRRVPRALLFYLASQGKLIGRENLYPVFWSEIPDQQARQRLRENLSRLRKDLPDPTLLIADNLNVSLDFNRIDVDLLAFDDLVDKVGQIPWQFPKTELLPEHTYQTLAAAIECWHGSQFLAGARLPDNLILDNWLSSTSLRLEQRRENILLRLTQHAYLAKNIDGALDYARMILDTDRTHDEAHYCVLRYLIETKQVNPARKYFEHIKKTYQLELNTNPPQKITFLYSQLNQQQQERNAPTSPNWAIHPSVETPFVGRKQELVNIHRVLEKHQGVFILGESGLGKTRLIKKLTNDLLPVSRLLVAVCRPLESTMPFNPICEVFRRHFTAQELQALPASWAGYLAHLLPEIKDSRPEIITADIPISPEPAQGLILEAIRQAFLLLSTKRQLFFVLDDAQWADDSTLSLIAYLLPRQPFNSNSSLTVIARDENIHPYFKEFLAAVQQSKDGTIINLPHFNSEEVHDLACVILQSRPDKNFIQRLTRDTGGNPFFVLETLRALMETEREPDLSKDGNIPLAKSISDLINIRVKKLPPATKKVIDAAAIIGTEFSPQLIKAVTEQSSDNIADALEMLENHSFIQPVHGGSGEVLYTFIHDKIRETLNQSFTPARMQLLHARVAQALEKAAIPVRASILASHYEAAGKRHLAFRYWTDTGLEARALFSVKSAFQAFKRAQSLLKDLEMLVTDDEIFYLYHHWTQMVYNMNDTETLRNLSNEVLELGEQRDSASLIGTAYDILSEADFTIDDYEKGLEHATLAIFYLRQSDNIARLVEAYNHQGVFLYMQNKVIESIEAFDEALNLSSDSTDPQVIRSRSYSHCQMAVVNMILGYPERGKNHAQLAVEFAQKIHQSLSHTLLPAYIAMTLSLYYCGDYRQAQKYAELSIELGEKTQAWRLLGYAQCYASQVSLGLGNIDAAAKQAGEAIQIGEDYQYNDVIAMGCVQLGNLYSNLNDYSTARDIYQRGAETSPGHIVSFDNLFRWGFTLCLLGEREQGHLLMNQTKTIYDFLDAQLGIILIQSAQALVYMQTQDWEKVKEITRHLNYLTLERSVPICSLWTKIFEGKISTYEGDSKAAIQYFNRVIDKANVIPAPWVEIEAQASLLAILTQTSKDTSAHEQRLDQLLDELKTNIKDQDNHKRLLVFRDHIYQTAGICQ